MIDTKISGMDLLLFSVSKAWGVGENRNPEVVVREFGIQYSESIPSPICGPWWFLNCKNVPNNLPDYLHCIHVLG